MYEISLSLSLSLCTYASSRIHRSFRRIFVRPLRKVDQSQLLRLLRVMLGVKSYESYLLALLQTRLRVLTTDMVNIELLDRSTMNLLLFGGSLKRKARLNRLSLHRWIHRRVHSVSADLIALNHLSIRYSNVGLMLLLPWVDFVG